MFRFIEFENLCDDEIRLVHKSYDEPDSEKGYAPRYGFSIILKETGEDIGVVYFSADTSPRQYLVGHLSYGISPAHAGHNYAMKACRLMKPVALAHGLRRLFIGAGFDNIASRKTIEKLGGVPITLQDVPDESFLQQLQDNKIEMYVWDIESFPSL